MKRSGNSCYGHGCRKVREGGAERGGRGNRGTGEWVAAAGQSTFTCVLINAHYARPTGTAGVAGTCGGNQGTCVFVSPAN